MPARKLSRAKILDAAIELIDEEGLAKLSMRRLADRLNVEAMSLYRHVDNKAALLDAVHDALLGQMEVPLSGRWDDDLQAMARAFRALLARHSAALPMFATRNATGPQALAQVERGLAILGQAGLSVAEALPIFQVVFTFVVGHSLYTYAPLPSTMVDYGALPVESFPLLQQLGGLSSDPEAEFEHGLKLLVEGIGRSLPKR